MTNTTVLAPMTSAEHTSNKISQATKIGKQVMKSELKKAYEIAEQATKVPISQLSALTEKWSVSISRFLDSKIASALANDSELDGMVRFINMTCARGDNAETPFTWEDLIDTSSSNWATKAICGGVAHGSTPKGLATIIEKGVVWVDITFAFRFDSPRDTQTASYRLAVPLTDDLINVAQQRLVLLNDHKAAKDYLAVLGAKMSNIDAVVEEMEANLLVKELQGSVEGQEVLDITSALVTQMLGDTPKLLGS